MQTGISTVAVGESAAGHSHRECILMYNVCATSAFIEAQIEFNRWFKSQAADPHFTLLDTTQLSIASTVDRAKQWLQKCNPAAVASV
jgi:hypothetical protein